MTKLSVMADQWAADVEDQEALAALKARGLLADSHGGHLLHEPWQVQTGQGGFYRVYTPYWRAVRDRVVAPPVPAPAHVAAPAAWPASDALADWQLGRAMQRGAAVVARQVRNLGQWLGQSLAGDAALAGLVHGMPDRFVLLTTISAAMLLHKMPTSSAA